MNRAAITTQCLASNVIYVLSYVILGRSVLWEHHTGTAKCEYASAGYTTRLETRKDQGSHKRFTQRAKQSIAYSLLWPCMNRIFNKMLIISPYQWDIILPLLNSFKQFHIENISKFCIAPITESKTIRSTYIIFIFQK